MNEDSLGDFWRNRGDLPLEANRAIAVRCAGRLLPIAILGVGRLSGPPWLNGEYLESLFRSIYFSTSRVAFGKAGYLSSARFVFSKSGRAEIGGYAAARAIRSLCALNGDESSNQSLVTADVGDLLDVVSIYLGKDSPELKSLTAAVHSDLEVLGGEAPNQLDPIRLLRRHLWGRSVPDWFANLWSDGGKYLRDRPDGFDLWADWFDNYIAGTQFGFGLGTKIEESLYLDLSKSERADFWETSPGAVNASLRELIDERRQQITFVESETGQSNLEQNQNALVWEIEPVSGVLQIDKMSGVEDLRIDPESQSRHAEVVKQSLEVLRLCKYHDNSSKQLSPLVESYLEAVGDDLANCSPSLLVMRGERLRVKLAFAIQNSDDSLTPPLPDDLLEALSVWQSYHNMLVGLDPVLDRRDKSQLGPDSKSVIVAPAEIRSMLNELFVAGVVSEDGSNELASFASVAPSEPNAADRRSRIASESAKNLAISTIDLALQTPKPLLIGGAMSIAALGYTSTAVGLISVLAALEYVKSHKKLLFSWFKESRSVTSVLEHFFDRLDGK